MADGGECVARPGSTAITPLAEPVLAGNLAHPELVEVSGMAFSKRRDDVLWMVNDSGNGPSLFAVKTDGSSLGKWSVDASNYDWEDMASVWLNGDAYLLIADVGDNKRARTFYRVDVLREPEIGTDAEEHPLRPVATIRFTFEGDSTNVESVATDGNSVYLLGKVRAADNLTKSSQIFRIPLTVVPDDTVHVAERLGEMPLRAPALPKTEADVFTNVMINAPTSFDMSDDGRFAHLLTYRNVVRFARESGQPWAEALESGGRWVHTHSLPQAEAIATAADGTVWFTSELPNAELWVLPAPR